MKKGSFFRLCLSKATYYLRSTTLSHIVIKIIHVSLMAFNAWGAIYLSLGSEVSEALGIGHLGFSSQFWYSVAVASFCGFLMILIKENAKKQPGAFLHRLVSSIVGGRFQDEVLNQARLDDLDEYDAAIERKDRWAIRRMAIILRLRPIQLISLNALTKLKTYLNRKFLAR
jgi:hypothetical protein